ncbi:unnamed protein product [Durusdinium trenchii]|uniref:ADP,ATP carrier protein n=1 Tax=Durusdinium trenchii TaxID=1381693 RepID=A0ABP0HQ21_9DINO
METGERPEPLDKEAIEGQLRLMANCFGAVHGGLGTLLVYSTTLFSEQCGSTANGFFYVSTWPGSMFLAVPLLSVLGRQGCLLYSFSSYVLYAILFCTARALQTGDVEKESCLSAGPVLLCSASVVAGLAAGVMWTSQGSYFAHASALLASGTEDPEAKTREANAWLSGVFALRYLGWEFALKLLTSLIQYFKQDDASILVLIVIAALATVVFARSDPLPREEPTSQGPALDKFRAAISLWSDVVIWLLSPTNLAFGFGAAFMNGYFNAEVSAGIAGTASIGALAAVTVASAALGSWCFGSYGQKHGLILPMALGSLAMLATMYFGLSEMKGLSAAWLFLPYLLWGFGRGSYESVNRAALADFYRGKKIDAAFANFTFQQCMASAIAFFVNRAKVSVTVTTIMALLIMPCYVLVMQRCSGEQRPVLQDPRTSAN